MPYKNKTDAQAWLRRYRARNRANNGPHPYPSRAIRTFATMKKLTYPLGSTMLRGRTAWFYHSRSGIHVVAEKWSSDKKYLATAQTNISWDRLCRAVDLHRAIEKQRAARRAGR